MPRRIRAIVTGHSQGLGAAMATQLLARNIPVLGCARNGNRDLASRFPTLLHETKLDLGNVDALRAWLEGETLQEFSRDADCVLLINNAGTLGPVGPAETQPLQEIATALQINVAAPLMLTAALARAHPGELRIVHISSGAARSPYAGWSVYCATKAALDHHARAISAEGRANLRICSLAPGVVDTEMQTLVRTTPESRFPMLKKFQRLKQKGHLTPPDTAAERIVAYLLDARFGEAEIADLRELPVVSRQDTH